MFNLNGIESVIIAKLNELSGFVDIETYQGQIDESQKIINRFPSLLLAFGRATPHEKLSALYHYEFSLAIMSKNLKNVKSKQSENNILIENVTNKLLELYKIKISSIEVIENSKNLIVTIVDFVVLG